jgi:mycofactocin precursor
MSQTAAETDDAEPETESEEPELEEDLFEEELRIDGICGVY